MCGRGSHLNRFWPRHRGRPEGSQLCRIYLVFGGLGEKKGIIKQQLIKQVHKQVFVICILRAGIISEERIAFWELEECTLPSILIQVQICLYLVANWLCQRGCLNARWSWVRYIFQCCNISWIRLEIWNHYSGCCIISLMHPQLIRSTH